MNYIVLDTCIILHVLRNKITGQRILETISKFEKDPVLVISTVTKGELESIKKQHGWGTNKCSSLDLFLSNITAIDINNDDETLHGSYSNIDAYSKGKSIGPGGEKLKGSARKMGKNDLWIAATAHILNAPLITADNDFDHLDSTFLKLVKV